MPTTASFELLSSKATLPRSSHSVALIQNVLYILGGEGQPKEPASPFLHALDLNGNIPHCCRRLIRRWISQTLANRAIPGTASRRCVGGSRWQNLSLGRSWREINASSR